MGAATKRKDDCAKIEFELLNELKKAKDRYRSAPAHLRDEAREACIEALEQFTETVVTGPGLNARSARYRHARSQEA